MSVKDLIAAAVHEQWSMWQKYQSKMLGNMTLTGDVWLEWDRKSKTEFKDLTLSEQLSDRVIAEQLWIPLFDKWLVEQANSESGTDWKSVIDTLRSRLIETKPMSEASK